MLKVNVSSWKRQIDANAFKVMKVGEKAFRRAAELMKNRIMEYTPVGNPSLWKYPAHKDYTPGYLRSNWKLTFNGQVASVTNDAPYAMRVENGWSSQAPNGMMRRAAMDYPQLLEQASREYKV